MSPDSEVERLRAELERLAPTTRGEGGAERLVELFGMFLANAPDFIALLGLDGTMLFVNRAAAGKSVADIVGRSVYDYADSKARPAVERVIATGQPFSFENTGRLSDGSTHSFFTRFSPVFSADRVVAVALIATDVTEQKRAEAALHESQDKLKVAVAATGMGLWSWNVQADVLEWDDTLCRIWGRTQATAPRSFAEYLKLLPEADRDRVRELSANMLAAGVFKEVEHTVTRPDGSTRRVLSKASVTHALDGSVERIIGGTLDITEQRELEERSRQTQKLEAIGQLSAGVAHNFNNMLMAMLPNIELAQANADPVSARLLRSAHQAGLRAAALVRQLLTFAGRARPVDKRADDVRALVERSVAICRRAFDRSIELTASCPAEAQPVLADIQLEQALLNLLINARDAVLDERAPAKRVRVDVERVIAQTKEHSRLGLELGRSYVCVRVSDTGIGMDSQTFGRMYEPFFTTKEVGRGTGLGLSTARAIVEEHGGALDCTTLERQGSTFFMYLPLAAELSPEVQSLRGVADPRSTKTILVIDDEGPVREATRSVLEGAGYSVCVAASGHEALELLSHADTLQRVALVLLDLSMPGMSGEAVRVELRKLAPRLKVVYFSGHTIDASNDVSAVIQKPATAAVLVNTLSEVLARADEG